MSADLDSSGGTASRILVVDDDDAVLRSLGRILARPGCRVTLCGDPARALEQLASSSFDVIVSDIRMPTMTGLQFLRVVRQYDAELQVILVTGWPDVATATAAVEYGAFQYLMKPVEHESLRAAVDRAADTTRAARIMREYSEEFGDGASPIGDRAGIDAGLNRALASIRMAYQPIVVARDGAPFAYEALLRSEERMFRSPPLLLRAAQRLGRMHDVGRAVWQRVAEDIDRADRAAPLVFVNVHAEELSDPAMYLPDSPLARHASRIVLEVTERAPLEQVTDVQQRIGRLRGLGFRLALDDLGAGYAGLSSFAQLDPDYVKLDLSLVRDVDRSPVKQKLVRAITNLCHDMSKDVIAEGVETGDERDTLVELDCDLLQGHFFARPGRSLSVAP